MRRSPALLWLCLLACGGSGGSRGHDLLEGRYAFSATEVISDPCGLLPAAGLWGGTMSRSGDYVRIDYDLLQLGLVGYYRYGVEEFYADGTAEAASITLGNGTSCALDQLQLHLTAVTRSPSQFDGTLAIHTYDRADNACECALSVGYRADRQ